MAAPDTESTTLISTSTASTDGRLAGRGSSSRITTSFVESVTDGTRIAGSMSRSSRHAATCQGPASMPANRHWPRSSVCRNPRQASSEASRRGGSFLIGQIEAIGFPPRATPTVIPAAGLASAHVTRHLSSVARSSTTATADGSSALGTTSVRLRRSRAPRRSTDSSLSSRNESKLSSARPSAPVTKRRFSVWNESTSIRPRRADGARGRARG